MMKKAYESPVVAELCFEEVLYNGVNTSSNEGWTDYYSLDDDDYESYDEARITSYDW